MCPVEALPWLLLVPAAAQVEAHFARLIQRVMPKSFAQAVGEVRVTRIFLENFSGDQAGGWGGAGAAGMRSVGSNACRGRAAGRAGLPALLRPPAHALAFGCPSPPR